MNNDFLLTFVTVLTAIFAIVSSVYLWTRSVRFSRYNDLGPAHRAKVKDVRASLEREIYQLNKLLLEEQNRWQDANHLLLSSQNISSDSQAERPRLTRFLKGAGISEEDLCTEDDLVFVLMPFHDEFLPAYKAICDVCSRVGLRCYRGDEEYLRGDILSHILKLLLRARVVVAIIDGRNPNVFYELGIAHALDKKTVLISETIEGVPFDVQSKRIVLYDSTTSLETKLAEELARALV